MTATLLGILFIAGILTASASLLASVGRYGEAVLELPEQLRCCRTSDAMRFRVRALTIELSSGARAPVSDRAVFQPRTAWLAAA